MVTRIERVGAMIRMGHWGMEFSPQELVNALPRGVLGSIIKAGAAIEMLEICLAACSMVPCIFPCAPFFAPEFVFYWDLLGLGTGNLSLFQ